ncbi:MAG: protein phosphatase 2C domain-containing protein [Chloroflexi bacterium]|nr:protein phosphatase 2C domain-containing protein [Chloroflexota bacterium]
MNGSWRYAFASVTGASHRERHLPCQDASACTLVPGAVGTSALVAVIADGAGSTVHGGDGAQLACTLFIESARAALEGAASTHDLPWDFVPTWLDQFQTAVAKQAEHSTTSPRDFSCTLLAAIIHAEDAAFLQVGDGAIVLAGPGSPDYFQLFTWPQTGEYENTTRFATDPGAADRACMEIVEMPIDEVTLLSDGLQRLALDYTARVAFQPFFGPLLSPLRAAPEGHAAQLSLALERFLSSPTVNNRTDDDKSLILASRRALEATAPSGDPENHGDHGHTPVRRAG